MRKSKSSTGSKGKRKHSPDEDKKKHVKSSSKVLEKERKKEAEDKLPRKTRWETSKSNVKVETDKQIPTSRNDETSNAEPPQRIKDMLGDKKKIVEYLFLTVTGTALQELIPDYLKNHSIEELKKMCYAEIKDMSDEIILDVASGYFNSDKAKSTSVKVDIKPIEAKSLVSKEESEKHTSILESSPKHSSPGVSESFSGDLLELCASSNEMKDLTDAEDEVPMSICQELADDLLVAETDADLIELEMRARAIRSLLKAKTQIMSDSDG